MTPNFMYTKITKYKLQITKLLAFNYVCITSCNLSAYTFLVYKIKATYLLTSSSVLLEGLLAINTSVEREFLFFLLTYRRILLSISAVNCCISLGISYCVM